MLQQFKSYFSFEWRILKFKTINLFMKYLYTLLTCIIWVNFCWAQRPNRGQGRPAMTIIIKGEVVDQSSKAALEFATISIFAKKDSALLTGGITEANGSYSFSVKPGGPMYAEVEFIGYESLTIDNLVPEKGKPMIDMGVIIMSAGGVNLDEVVVRAEKSDMQFSLDKRIFNVGKDLASRGGNASDVLDNIPSVTVGVEGEVSLRGSENVRILINGRPSGLIGLNGTDGLRTINASMIERVEVITNPSSKFEAEGMAGIINIILKKDRAKGFNGSFELTGGTPLQYGVGANLNYRQDKFNFFLNYSYRKRTGDSNGNRYQEFYLEDITKVSLQKQVRERSGEDHSFRFGSDYLLSDNEVLTAAFLYRYGEDNNNNFVEYRDADFPAGSLMTRPTNDFFNQYILRTDTENELEPTLEYSLRYDKKFKDDGHKLTADVSFQSNDEEESSFFRESLFENNLLVDDALLLQRSANEEGQRQWRLQLDYSKPFDNGYKSEMGALGTFRQISNNFLVETFATAPTSPGNMIWVIEEGLSNDFIYDEDVLGGYANIGKDFEKISFQVGARAEYSRIRTELLQTNELNDRNYVNFFPSGFVSYKMEGENSFQASYSRRIRRPRFWDLNPFFTFTDRRNFFSGNPDLNPEFTDSYEIGHLKYWENGNIGSSIYYRHTSDNIQRVQTQDVENQTTVRRPENVGTGENMGFEFLFAYTGIKWLRLDGSINGFRFITKGTSDAGQDFNVDNYAWTSRLNSRISFWKNADLQLRLNYRAPRETLQGNTKSITSLNIAFSKDFTPNLTFTLAVQDAFNNRKRRGEFIADDFYEESDFQWRPRTLIATLNYRINKKKERPKRGGYEAGGSGEF